MRERLQDLARNPLLRRIPKLWRRIEFLEGVFGVWDRIPRIVKGALRMAVEFALAGIALAFLAKALEVGQNNWPFVVIVALIITLIVGLLIEHYIFPATSGPTGTVVVRKFGRDDTAEGSGTITATGPVYVPEDEEVEKARADQVKEWRSLINDITEFVYEGNRAMEAYGRPQHLDSTRGLDFMNGWIPRVGNRLPDEYRVDFDSAGRDIFKGDAVWAEQLDIRLTRLREIVADIRNRHL